MKNINLKNVWKKIVIGSISIFTVLIIVNIFSGCEETEDNGVVEIEYTEKIPLQKHRELTPREIKWAFVAWQYFAKNTFSSTGLVSSISDSNITTTNCIGAYLTAIISAEKLGIISHKDYKSRIQRVLNSLEKLPLTDDLLPNKYYLTSSLGMVDKNGNQARKGIGWDAAEIIRLMSPLKYILWAEPQYSEQIIRIINRWDISQLNNDYRLYSAEKSEDGKIQYYQEDSRSLIEYADKAASFVCGFEIEEKCYLDSLELIEIYDIDYPYYKYSDSISNSHKGYDQQYLLMKALEFGLNKFEIEWAYRSYKVQELRYKTTGKYTATGVYYVDSLKDFISYSVYAEHHPWIALAESGKPIFNFNTATTKNTFAWYALFEKEYSEKLIKRFALNFDEKKGWYEGIYEKTNKPNKAITCQTNSFVLEALAFIFDGYVINSQGK